MPILGSFGGASAKGYGLQSGKPKIVATGGTITNAGGYTIHTFSPGSSNFVVTKGAGLPVEYIIVGAGGGGGGAGYGGDGGGSGAGNGASAGAFNSGTFNVAIQSYATSVGTGAGGGGFRGTGGTGGSSSFNGVTSNGGGGAGWAGGFGSYGSPGSGTSNVNSISGSSVTYSKPGPGGSFAYTAQGIPGDTPGTGGGGGSGDNEGGGANGGTGGNGIIIIRYLT